MSGGRWVCIHGHFYQPPRENPWLEVIEPQESAAPYHDWNARITDESYAPNAAARILDQRGRIRKIVNNYSAISFDFGPTLLEWLQRFRPEVYQAILDADRQSAESFGGHGSAMAQAYNHLIQPLANRRDKRTQIIWGVRDFEHRFRRRPAGMWLPETAVDVESLELMAEQRLRFTVLAPHQAGRVRRIGNGDWQRPDGGIDTTTPYRLALPSGNHIAVFFYDGPTSRAVAFEKLLDSGSRFVDRLLGGTTGSRRASPALLHIATDGETYGHHHAHGDMALAFAIETIRDSSTARLTNYAEFLERYPPSHEAEIIEGTSWSCSHGVERWRADCGCSTGAAPGWNQAWRAPLRAAFDWLRDGLAVIFEDTGSSLLDDPWAARDDYISVILQRDEATVDSFLTRHAARQLSDWERVRVLRLLEMQRHAMLMYTSCGWFFADLAGIETVQVLRYAARALQLAEQVTGEPLEETFLEHLERAVSNRPQEGDGRQIWERHVRSSRVDLQRLTAHYAITSLFREQEERSRVYGHAFEMREHRLMESGRRRLVVGHVEVESEVTGDHADLTFGAVYLGDHNLQCGVRDYAGNSPYGALVDEVTAAFDADDLPELLRALDRHLGIPHYTLRSLLGDEQVTILNSILESTLEEIQASYRQIYEHHAAMLRFLGGIDLPVVEALRVGARLVLNAEMRRCLEADPPSLTRFRQLLEEARRAGVPIDSKTLGFVLEEVAVRITERIAADPGDSARLEQLQRLLEMGHEAPLPAKLWKVQNLFYELVLGVWPAERQRAEAGDAAAEAWVARFRKLAELLSLRID